MSSEEDEELMMLLFLFLFTVNLWWRRRIEIDIVVDLVFVYIKGAQYSNRVWFLKLKNYRVRSFPKNSSHMESEVKHEYQIKRNFEIFLACHN